MRTRALLIAWVTLAGCGGGSGGDDSEGTDDSPGTEPDTYVEFPVDLTGDFSGGWNSDIIDIGDFHAEMVREENRVEASFLFEGSEHYDDWADMLIVFFEENVCHDTGEPYLYGVATPGDWEIAIQTDCPDGADGHRQRLKGRYWMDRDGEEVDRGHWKLERIEDEGGAE